MSKATTFTFTGSSVGDMCLGIPSLPKLQDAAKADIPKLGDDKTITVWGFQLAGEYPAYDQGVIDGSTFVARVECYLKLIGKDYVKAKTVGLRENPRHAVPFANIYGTMVDDSSCILALINQHFKIDPKKNLTPAQVALGHLIQRLLMESLYFVGLYETFATEHGRAVVKSEFEADIPAFVFPVIFPMILRDQMNRLQGQGIAKRTMEQIHEKGKEDLVALATLLGTNQYILGTDRPTLYDTDVYAFVSAVFYTETFKNLDWVQTVKKECPLFAQYIDRMRSLLFPAIGQQQDPAKTH